MAKVESSAPAEVLRIPEHPLRLREIRRILLREPAGGTHLLEHLKFLHSGSLASRINVSAMLLRFGNIRPSEIIG
jgi:hypothetical protein